MIDIEPRLLPPSMTEGSVEDHAEEWLIFIYSGDAREDDLARFHRWLDEDPIHMATYRRVERQWRNLVMDAAYSDVKHDLADDSTNVVVPLDFGDNRSRKSARQSLKARPRKNLFGLAAGMAAVFIAGILGFLIVGLPESGRYVTTPGEIKTVTLADGSEIILGGDSVMKTTFLRNQRNVQLLSGGAYFKVSPDSDRPFRVKVSDVAVTVVGTSFDIRKNPDDVRVSVEEGHVRVSPVHKLPFFDNPKGVVMLNSGDQVTASKTAGVGKVTRFDPEVTLGWSQGYLVYKDEKLSDLIAEVNRYRRDKIRLADPALGAISVSFIMPIDDTDRLLEVLTRNEKLHIERSSSEVVLSREH